MELGEILNVELAFAGGAFCFLRENGSRNLPEDAECFPAIDGYS